MNNNFPFGKNNKYFDFGLSKEQFTILSIAFNESFALFEIKENKKFDYNKIANLVYNIIQSKLKKSESLINNDNENNSFKLNTLKEYIDELEEYFFFKDYNSTKKYDNLFDNELENLIDEIKKNNKTKELKKAKKTKIPESKIKELETKLKNKIKKKR